MSAFGVLRSHFASKKQLPTHMPYGASPKYAQRQEVRFLTRIPSSQPQSNLSSTQAAPTLAQSQLDVPPNNQSTPPPSQLPPDLPPSSQSPPPVFQSQPDIPLNRQFTPPASQSQPGLLPNSQIPPSESQPLPNLPPNNQFPSLTSRPQPYFPVLLQSTAFPPQPQPNISTSQSASPSSHPGPNALNPRPDQINPPAFSQPRSGALPHQTPLFKQGSSNQQPPSPDHAVTVGSSMASDHQTAMTREYLLEILDEHEKFTCGDLLKEFRLLLSTVLAPDSTPLLTHKRILEIIVPCIQGQSLSKFCIALVTTM